MYLFYFLNTENAVDLNDSPSLNDQTHAPWSVRVRDQLKAITSPLNLSFCGYLCGVLLIQAGHIVPYGLLPTRAKVRNIR